MASSTLLERAPPASALNWVIAINAVPCPTVHKVTDSQSGTHLRQKSAHRPTSHPFLPLLVPCSDSVWRHTRAHPEKRKKYHQYTDDDKGVDKADALASGDVDRFLRDNSSGHIRHIMARDFFADLLNHTHLPVAILDGAFNMHDLQHLHDQAVYHKYLATRDNYRNTRLGQPPLHLTLERSLYPRCCHPAPNGL